MSSILQGLPQVAQDGKYYWYTDKTGAYDASANVGGWGDPNFELNQSALLVFVYRMENPKRLATPVGSEIKHSPSALNTDELTFQFEYMEDGYIQWTCVRLMVSTDDNQSIDTTPVLFNEGDYWYNSNDGLVKQLVSGVPVTQDLTDTDILDAIAASSSVIFLVCELPIMKNLAVELNSRYNKKRDARRKKNKEQERRMRDDVSDIYLGMVTSNYQFRYGFKSNAHDSIDSLLDDFNI